MGRTFNIRQKIYRPSKRIKQIANLHNTFLKQDVDMALKKIQWKFYIKWGKVVT
jgi:hypothetical protein